MKTSLPGNNRILLFAAAALLGTSIWVLQADYIDEFTRRVLLNDPQFVVRQGIAGLLALGMAFAMGRFLPSRQITRFWWLPVALLGLLLIAVPLPMGIPMVNGTHWWQRSFGFISTILALIGAMSVVLPRFERGERGGIPALAALMLLAPMLSLWFASGFVSLFLLLAVLGLVLLAVVHGWRLWAALAALLTGSLATLFLKHPTFGHRFFEHYHNLDPYGRQFQLFQSMASIHAGALTGCRKFPPNIPYWHTDFIFGRFCGAAGLLAGLAVLLLTGLLLTLLWQVAARQRNPQSRVVAAGCAAVFTAQSLFYVAVNVGLWPTMAFHFPFLSFGPQLLLLDGFLLGLLLSLNRGTNSDEPLPARWPTTVITIGVWVLIALFAFRLQALVFRSPHLAEMRAQQVRRIEELLAHKKIKPARGRILDVNGTVLAQSGKRFTVCADPSRVPKAPERDFLPELARLTGLDEATLADRIADPTRRYVRLIKNLPAETAEAIRRMHVSGIFVEPAPSRDYPPAAPLAHLVGFINSEEEMKGGGGVEMTQNSTLSSGKDVRLTLDIKLQAAVQQIAEDAAVQTQAKQVQIIVMNPRTGAIRAAAQVPAAHGGSSGSAEMASLWWRAATDVFEPGGLLKPLVMASALESGTLNADTVINCESGRWLFADHPMLDASPFGELKPDEILRNSSNIGMAKIGILMGQQPLHDALVRWSLTKPCSAGLPAAPSGLLSHPARWSALEITRIPIGHGCAFSLLQILRAYTAIYNEGRMVEPYWVENTTPPEPKQVLKPETALWIRDAMTRVVEEGNGRKARIEGLPIAGMTSVAQKVKPGDTGYDPRKVQTAFIGGFEKSGEPCLVAVWLDEPEREGLENPAVKTFHEVAPSILQIAGTQDNTVHP